MEEEGVGSTVFVVERERSRERGWRMERVEARGTLAAKDGREMAILAERSGKK